MPRRSSRQTTAATPEKSEARVTRRSIRGNKADDEDVVSSPAKSDTSRSSKRSTKAVKETNSPATCPAPTRRGRTTPAGDAGSSSRARGAQSKGRGRGKKVKDESDEEEGDNEEEEDYEDEAPVSDEEEVKPKKRGRGRGASTTATSPSPRGRRGRPKKPESEDEAEEEEYKPDEPAKVKSTPPARASSRRGRAATKEKVVPDESPRRRSGRKAAKEAEEKIRTDAENLEPKEDEEEPKEDEAMEMEEPTEAKTEAEETKGTKRKHDEVEEVKEKIASPVKKQKTEEVAKTADTEEEAPEKPAAKDSELAEKAKPVAVPCPQIEEISEESAGEEPAKDEPVSAEDEDEPMVEAPAVIKATPTLVKEPTPQASPVKKPTPQPSPAKEPPVKEPTPQPSPVKDPTPSPVKVPTPQSSPVKEQTLKPSPVKEPTPQPSPVKEPTSQPSPVKKPAPIEKPEITEHKDETQPAVLSEGASGPIESSAELSEVPPILQPEPTTAPAEEAMDTSEPAASSKPQDKHEDYVMINMEDVPPPDSSEVSKSIPEVRVTPPEQDNGIEQSHESSATTASVNTSANQEAPSNSVPSPTTNNDCNNTETIANSAPVKTDPKDPLFCRRFLSNPAINFSSVVPENTFTLLTYNILADCHAQRAGYKWISAEHLALEYRHRRLMEELRYLNGDIICLQEVGPEHYHKLLQPQLAQLGYQGTYIKRPDNYYDEGEATFIRMSRFTVLHTELLDLSVIAKRDLDTSGMDPDVLKALKTAVSKPGVAVLTRLQCMKTKKTITIGNIHISWEWFKRADIQCVQAAATIRELVTLAGGADQPHVICGDFNSCPDSPIHQLTKEGYLNDASMTTLQGVQQVQLDDGKMRPMVNLWWRGFQHTSNNLKSAYATVMGSDPKSSKYPTDGQVRQVDYIWYASGTLDVVGVAETAPEANIQQGIPNSIYPSDHVSTKAMLAFKG